MLTYMNGSGPDRRVQDRGQPGGVLVRLQLDAGKGVTGRLRFENARSLPVDKQHVVGEPVARRQRELAYGDAPPGGEVHRVAVLDNPARLDERLVDLPTGPLLRRLRHTYQPEIQLPFSS